MGPVMIFPYFFGWNFFILSATIGIEIIGIQKKQIITHIHSRREYISIENKSSPGTPKPRRGFTLFDSESPSGEWYITFSIDMEALTALTVGWHKTPLAQKNYPSTIFMLRLIE
jgi:hypothetical protein